MLFRKNRFNRLLQARLTGTIKPEEEEELLRLASASGRNKSDYDRLMDLEEHLIRETPAEEPVDIAYDVMRTIRSSGSKKKDMPDPAAKFHLITPFPVHYAVLLVIGLVIGSAATWVAMPGKSSVPDSLVSGSMSANTFTGMSYHKDYITLRMVPFRMDSLYYLNFIINAKEEMEVEISYNESEWIVKKSEYISSPGNLMISSNHGQILIPANGNTNFQLILEKTVDKNARITVTGRQNNSLLTTKQIFLD